MKRIDIAASIKHGNGRYSLGDSMSLVVRGNSALFEYQYREDKRTRTLVLGSATGPAAMTITAAREARAAAWLARRNGVALAMPGIRSTAPRGDSFGKAAATYLTNHSAEWSPGHRSGLAGLVRMYAGPLNPLPVNRITTDQVADALRPIWNGPGDNRGSRLRRLIESVLTAKGVEPNPASWAKLRELLSKKVADVVSKAAMPSADVPAFIATLGNDVESRATLFVILTAVRRKEALGARWSEFDFANQVWTVSAARMKMKRDHAVPLTDAMMACIGPAGDADAFVFPNKHSGGMLSHHACSMLEFGFTLHGFRATFATWAEAQDDGRAYPQSVITAALAHGKGDKVTAAYLRSDHFEARRKLMAAWSAFATGKYPDQLVRVP
jgi:integrase